MLRIVANLKKRTLKRQLSQPARRIAISLSAEELREVEALAQRYSMKDAALCAYFVRFYLSNFGDQALQPLRTRASSRTASGE